MADTSPHAEGHESHPQVDEWARQRRRDLVDATLDEIRRAVSGEFGEPPRGQVVPADAYVAHIRTVLAALDAVQADDRIERALAVLDGAPIPMGEVRARHAAAILRGDRG